MPAGRVVTKVQDPTLLRKLPRIRVPVVFRLEVAPSILAVNLVVRKTEEKVSVKKITEFFFTILCSEKMLKKTK